MCTSTMHMARRVELALRLADVLSSKGATAADAEQFGPGGRLVVAQVAAQLARGRRLSERELRHVDTPSDETWVMAVVVMRHREIGERIEAAAVAR